ncbi:MAG: SpoIIE family protein phosphatase [Flammeovirgaceae bacterium]|nr:SpoIIE family protein phosphatase [Flammeovirgaceae bacterium]MDW8286836.1 two-component regulator propeller domain-containing protein [Flammeovirgaceae bacterium]
MKRLIFILLSSCWFFLSAAQTFLEKSRTISQYNIEIWDATDGLPTNGALHMIQSHDGYIWLGTFNGLVKFDGVDMQIYDRSNVEVLTNNVFEFLLQQNDSTFWFCTQGGLAKKVNEHWQIFTTQHGLPGNPTEMVFIDSRKRLWLATTSGLCYQTSDSTFSSEGLPEILQKHHVRAIAEDKQGTMWFAVGKYGVICIRQDGTVGQYDEKKLSSPIVWHICPMKNGNIWLATESGVNIIKPDGSVGRISSLSGLPSDFVYYIYEDNIGEIWVGTEKGLAKVLPGRISALSKSEDIDYHSVTSILQDKEGHIWATTYRNGFYRLKTGRFYTYSKEEGLVDDLVYGVFENKEDGTLLIATENGISVFDTKEEVVGREFSLYPLNQQLPSTTVRDIMKDSQGYWWIGTRNGLVRVSPRNQIEIIDISKGLPANQVRNILETKEGDIWIGTVEGIAIYKNGKITTLTRNEGLSNNFILSIFQDSKGAIWVGTREGLNKIRDQKVEKVYSLRNGMAGDVTFKLYEDKEGLLWVGVNGGLNVILPDGKVRNFAGKLGHWGQTVFEVVEDDTGIFWMTCNEGVFAVKRQDLIDYLQGKIKEIPSRLYNKEDGLKVSEPTPNGRICKASDGKLWIPTIRGVAVLNPYEKDLQNMPPPVAIDFVKVDYQDQPLNKPIIVPAGNQRIEIKYTGLSYKAPYNIQFKHFLENFDKVWIYAGKRREAFYTNLPPGEYFFKVSAANTDGVWSKPYVLKIVKLPYVWQTWWFWFSMVVVSGMLGWGIVQWRMTTIARRNQMLERLIAERTEQVRKQSELLEKQRDELAYSYQTIQKLSEIGQDLTASLSIESIVRKVYQNLSQFLPVDVFGIGIVDEKVERIDFIGYNPLTNKLTRGYDTLDDATKLSVWAWKNQSLVFIQDFDKQYQAYLEKVTTPEKIKNSKSVIYVPMIVKDRCLGVLSVHANKPHAYTDNDLNIVKSLAVYIAIAIDNARVYEELNFKNQKMLESISYAQKIQNTLLPSQEKIRELLPESFILFRPRDIVSGDIYWVEELVDAKGVSKIVVAVVDCTGHGVPGAIMSMIAFEQLAEIVLLYRKDVPSEILDYLNFGVRNILKQEISGMQDGMDMAICVINQEERYVEFAGAKNPLIYVQDGQLCEIKGDRMSVGGFWRDKEAKFTNHRIPLKKDTFLYMFSDGFQDQFGGKHNKKFTQKQLKEVLYSLHTLPMNQQHELLLGVLRDWMLEDEEHSQEQLDDILVMGIKLS